MKKKKTYHRPKRHETCHLDPFLSLRNQGWHDCLVAAVVVLVVVAMVVLMVVVAVMW